MSAEKRPMSHRSVDEVRVILHENVLEKLRIFHLKGRCPALEGPVGSQIIDNVKITMTLLTATGYLPMCLIYGSSTKDEDDKY